MSQPLSWYQSELPPASHCVAFVVLAVNGAMNRAFTSGGEMSVVVDCDKSRKAFGRSGPGFAQVRVTRIDRATYSWTMLQPSFGSTSTSPPSPPKFDTIFGEPGRSSEPPLSWRPPLTSTPSPDEMSGRAPSAPATLPTPT